MADMLPDGVFLNLPAETYFQQDRMGSSDWIRLHKTQAGWWWSSRHNPDRIEERSKERTYGSALHALLLEGVAAYEARFAVQPEPRDFPGLVTSVAQIKARLEQEGFAVSGTSKWTKQDWNDAMLRQLPDVPCWDNLIEDFQARIGEREPISSLDHRMLMLMHHIATDPARPDNEPIRKLLVESERHPALAEVTIFSTIDGIQRRWRIDKMLPGLDIDLKSVGQWRGRPLQYEVGQVIATNCWDIQRADYAIGRAEAYRLIREGDLYGGTIEQRNYIQEIVEYNPTFDWLWLCYGKPEATGRAPIILPVWDSSWESPGEPGPLRRYGQRKLDRAIAFYKASVARFGLDTPWARVEPLHYTDSDLSPAIVLPHWVAEDAPIEAEAYGEAE